jgi:hypothetical protein
VPDGLKTATVTVAGKPVRATAEVTDGRMLITLSEEVVLKEGEALNITIN